MHPLVCLQTVKCNPQKTQLFITHGVFQGSDKYRGIAANGIRQKHKITSHPIVKAVSSA
jgi:hypothetical protein